MAVLSQINIAVDADAKRALASKRTELNLPPLPSMLTDGELPIDPDRRHAPGYCVFHFEEALHLQQRWMQG